MSKFSEMEPVLPSTVLEALYWLQLHTPDGLPRTHGWHPASTRGYLANNRGHGFRQSEQWPFSVSLAIGNDDYFRALLRALVDPEYAQYWRERAQSMLLNVVMPAREARRPRTPLIVNYDPGWELAALEALQQHENKVREQKGSPK